MGKTWIVETVKDDNRALYLANVYLLKVAGRPMTGNEWKFDDQKNASAVANMLNSTFGCGIWRIAQVVEIDEQVNEDTHSVKQSNAEKTKAGKTKKSESVKTDKVSTQSIPDEDNNQDEDNVELEMISADVDKEIDWYSDLSDDEDDSEVVVPESKKRSVSKNGKPLAQPIYKEDVPNTTTKQTKRRTVK